MRDRERLRNLAQDHGWFRRSATHSDGFERGEVTLIVSFETHVLTHLERSVGRSCVTADCDSGSGAEMMKIAAMFLSEPAVGHGERYEAADHHAELSGQFNTDEALQAFARWYAHSDWDTPEEGLLDYAGTRGRAT